MSQSTSPWLCLLLPVVCVRRVEILSEESFYATGTTEAAAKRIAQIAGADIHEIAPETQYTAADFDWTDSLSRRFEMPVIIWLFGKMGLLTPAFLRSYRKHAIVIILVAAAIITPTSDIFTLLVVSLPMWLLYEFGIFLIRDKS